jgi:GT2 family glycosyltransferase
VNRVGADEAAIARTEPPQLRFRVRRGAQVADAPAVSVIALVTQDVTWLERCLRSVREVTPQDISSEVIVVANGTAPAALRDISVRQDVVLIESPVNLGFGGGCNLAARLARGKRLVFLNDDVVVTPGWLEGLNRVMDEDERAAVVGSKVLLRDGELQEAGCVLWSDGSTSGVGRGDDPSKPAYLERRAVDYVSFCSAMVRRSAWEAAGGFDDRYFPAYYEDVDLCLTMQVGGWRVMYEPTSVVHHAEGASASRDFRDFASRRNQRQFVAKWAVTLSTYRHPPTNAERADAVEQALRQASKRQAAVDAPPAADHRPPAADVSDLLDDAVTSKLIVDKLYADSLVKAEYIRLLEERVANRGVRDVLRTRLSRYRSSRGRNR